MLMTIVDIGGVISLILFVLISLYLFSTLPSIFIKFICAVMSLACGCAGFAKIPRIDFASFIVCLVVVLYYSLLRIADYILKKEGIEEISIFPKKDEDKPRYFRF